MHADAGLGGHLSILLRLLLSVVSLLCGFGRYLAFRAWSAMDTWTFAETN